MACKNLITKWCPITPTLSVGVINVNIRWRCKARAVPTENILDHTDGFPRHVIRSVGEEREQ